jgi:hypothetical protein
MKHTASPPNKKPQRPTTGLSSLGRRLDHLGGATGETGNMLGKADGALCVHRQLRKGGRRTMQESVFHNINLHGAYHEKNQSELPELRQRSVHPCHRYDTGLECDLRKVLSNLGCGSTQRCGAAERGGRPCERSCARDVWGPFEEGLKACGADFATALNRYSPRVTTGPWCSSRGLSLRLCTACSMLKGCALRERQSFKRDDPRRNRNYCISKTKLDLFVAIQDLVAVANCSSDPRCKCLTLGRREGKKKGFEVHDPKVYPWVPYLQYLWVNLPTGTWQRQSNHGQF